MGESLNLAPQPKNYKNPVLHFFYHCAQNEITPKSEEVSLPQTYIGKPHFIILCLLCFRDVAFFYTLKVKPSISKTRFIAVV